MRMPPLPGVEFSLIELSSTIFWISLESIENDFCVRGAAVVTVLFAAGLADGLTGVAAGTALSPKEAVATRGNINAQRKSGFMRTIDWRRKARRSRRKTQGTIKNIRSCIFDVVPLCSCANTISLSK